MHLDKISDAPEIKFIQLHPDAKLPVKANELRDDALTGDTCYDIFCVEDKVIPAKSSAVVDTGLQVGYITPGYWYRIEARSGLSFKFSVIPHFGVIDNPYRGINTVKLYNLSDKDYEVKKGDRIAQLAMYQLIKVKISWTEKADETDRGAGRLGSTGR